MNGWTTTSIASRYLVALLDEAGVEVDDVLADAAVSRATLATSDVAMPLPAFGALWTRAAALRPDIGIALVEQFPPGQMHILAHLAMRSATVGEALADVCRYAGVTSAADVLALDVAGDRARFTYSSRAPAPAIPWFAEHYLSMTMLFLTQAVARPLALLRVTFAAPRLAAPADYVRRFGIAPDFAADANALEFAAPVLAWPLLTHDTYLHGILERVAQARSVPVADTLLEAVRAEIGRSLLRGATPAMDAVAAACRLSPRGLRDRLAKLSTTFRHVLDDVRRDLAREHLARGLSVTEVSYLLGFAEPAAFQHACRRWFGQSAGALRRELLLVPTQATAGSSGHTPATRASK